MPLALVVSYRELAFGPLKSIPELDAIGPKLESIEEIVARLKEDIDGEIPKLIAELRRDLSAAYTKLGLPQ